MKIDLVYLWCDANEKKIKNKKQKYISLMSYKEIQNNNFALNDCRWRDNDELKYSLRSVEKFIPWINHIYIVTDNQIPSWLDTNNPKITIIDHKDIIPEKYLPTFNSNVIEAHLPYIKELSEYFLYANDDCFVNDYLEPSYFFTKNGKPIINVKKSKLRYSNNKTYQNQLLILQKEINEKFNTKYLIEDSHNIIPYRKSFLTDNLNDKFAKKWFDTTFLHKFRSEEDVQRFIHVLLDNIKKRNILRIQHKHTINIFLTIFSKTNFLYINHNPQIILKRKPKLFCVNDEENSSDETIFNNIKFLKHYFHTKSQFEK